MKPLLFQLMPVVFHHPTMHYSQNKSLLWLLHSSPAGTKDCHWVPPKPFHFHSEPALIPQVHLTNQVLKPWPNWCPCAELTVVYWWSNFTPVLGGPKLGAVVQPWFNKCQVKGKNLSILHGCGCGPVNAAQETVITCHASRAHRWLLFSSLSSTTTRALSAEQLPAQLVPSLSHHQGFFFPICRTLHMGKFN